MRRAVSGRTPSAVAIATLLAATLLAGCDKPDVPAPAADGAPAAPAAPSAPAAAAAPDAGEPQALQPEEPVAATGTLSPGADGAALAPVDAIGDKGPTCNLETIGGKNTSEPNIEVKAGGTMNVSGWMFSLPTQSIPVNRYLRIETEDGSQTWQTVVGNPAERPDILPWFNIRDWALRSGFSQDVNIADLPAGRYHLLLTFSENGKQYKCDNGRMINIVP